MNKIRIGAVSRLADKKAEPFELQVDWIRAYGGDDTPASGAH